MALGFSLATGLFTSSTPPDLVQLSPPDQLYWQVQKGARQASEAVQYQLWRLLSSSSLGDADEAPTWLEPLVLWTARILLVVIVLAVLYGIIRWIGSQFRQRSQQQTQIVQQTLQTPPLQVHEWLDRAQQAQQQGDYAAACRALYMALLMRLEALGWSQGETDTDREYLRGLEACWALSQEPLDPRNDLRQIFQTHEAILYGAQSISQEQFHRCQQAYVDLERHLQSGSLA